jgi:hypothetical protein
MSSMTRQVLDNLGTMLKQAPALEPSDTRPQNRAEAPAAAPAQAAGNTPPSVAAAVPEASAPEVSGGQAASSGPAASEPGATAPPQ